MSNENRKIISIEGNIGSGKTTIIDALKHFCENNEKYVFVSEPLNIWTTIIDLEGNSILKKFYDDQEKYSFPFQMMAYISRLSLLKQAVKENPNATIITERSLNTDKYVFAQMLYDDNKIEDVCMQIYTLWFEQFVDDLKIDSTIYVKTDPNICLQRINIRHRDGEESIPLTYLESCDKYHETMLYHLEPETILHINGNIEYDDDGLILKERLEQIFEFINA